MDLPQAVEPQVMELVVRYLLVPGFWCAVGMGAGSGTIGILRAASWFDVLEKFRRPLPENFHDPAKFARAMTYWQDGLRVMSIIFGATWAFSLQLAFVTMPLVQKVLLCGAMSAAAGWFTPEAYDFIRDKIRDRRIAEGIDKPKDDDDETRLGGR